MNLGAKKMTAAFLALLALARTVAADEPSGKGLVVIRAARLIDGTGAEVVGPALIVIENERIRAVGRQGTLEVPEKATIVDLGDVTLLPGFIDCHTHVAGRTLGSPGAETAVVRDFAATGAILGVGHVRDTLMAGFTTIRVVGSSDFDDIALRAVIQEGAIVGPRMVCCGHGIGVTGGHADVNGYRPGLLDVDYKHGIADGADECRKAVRYQVKQGADAIKIVATGGVLSEGDAVGATQYAADELKALLDEATKLERKVAAHAHGTEGIKLAVAAGVASIEHGSFLDDEGARMMAERGTYLVPTLMAAERVEQAAQVGILKGQRAEKAAAAAAGMRNAIKKAVAFGVPVALGTDAGVIAHGTNAREFQLMVEWGGLSPMNSILAGTRNASKLLGLDAKIGTLEAGKLADVVAVQGNPLDDIRQLQKPVFVMKNGVIHRQPATEKSE
jgi:imidazolonepropionase-like amidohydrolase